MKKLVGIFIFFFSLGAWAQEPPVNVYVEQNGKRYLLNNRTVKIDNQPFTLVFEFDNIEETKGIYINTSMIPQPYYMLFPSQSIPDLKYLPQKVFSEYKYNPDNELKVHPEFFQYFGYNPKRNWYKFNRIEKKGKKLIGYRKVEQLDIVEKRRKVKVRQFKRPLYLFFTVLEENPGSFHKRQEKFRFKGKIKFK